VRLDDASQLTERLASPEPEPAAGIALCTAGAMAAALISKACALSPAAGLEGERAHADRLRADLLSSAERDVAAFHAVLLARRSGGDERAAWAAAGRVLRDAAALLEETRALAEDVAGRCKPALRGEPLAAALLAAGARSGALALADLDEKV
jgi:formiminotetrahydrofolate cyclodeaminase